MRPPGRSAHTTPLNAPPVLTLQTLVVDVVEGNDAGKSYQSDAEVLSVGSAKSNDVVLSDSSVSGFHVELARSERGVLVRDLGSTNGTRLRNALIERAVVALGTTLQLGRTAIRVGAGKETVVAAGTVVPPGLVATSPAMRKVLAQVDRVAQSAVSALFLGESGTGKDVMARLLHERSPRARGPFVTVDCGAFNRQLVASELFGHERGAFTGAERRHQGAFERASGGTLFLDEVGELPIDLQPQLLGVLERRRFRRLGGSDEIGVDVTIVSATNRDLREEVNTGTFRLDLYYRLAGVVLRLPPLRERRADVPLLLEHFVRERGLDEPLEELVTSEVLDNLLDHPWPGNLRELRNWVDATLVLGEASELPPTDSSRGPEMLKPRAVARLSYRDAREQVLADFEQTYLKALLERTGSNVSRAAREARMDRTYLSRLIQRHGLK